jgi:hypothetical protein
LIVVLSDAGARWVSMVASVRLCVNELFGVIDVVRLSFDRGASQSFGQIGGTHFHRVENDGMNFDQVVEILRTHRDTQY